MDTILVKIINVSRPLYWYKNRIGEFLEVRKAVHHNASYLAIEQYYLYERKEDGLVLYINFNDCVDCTRYQKIKKLKDKLYENQKC